MTLPGGRGAERTRKNSSPRRAAWAVTKRRRFRCTAMYFARYTTNSAGITTPKPSASSFCSGSPGRGSPSGRPWIWPGAICKTSGRTWHWRWVRPSTRARPTPLTTTISSASSTTASSFTRILLNIWSAWSPFSGICSPTAPRRPKSARAACRRGPGAGAAGRGRTDPRFR